MRAKAAVSTCGTSRATVDSAPTTTSLLPGSGRPQRDEAAMRSEHSRPGSEPRYQETLVVRTATIPGFPGVAISKLRVVWGLALHTSEPPL